MPNTFVFQAKIYPTLSACLVYYPYCDIPCTLPWHNWHVSGDYYYLFWMFSDHSGLLISANGWLCQTLSCLWYVSVPLCGAQAVRSLIQALLLWGTAHQTLQVPDPLFHLTDLPHLECSLRHTWRVDSAVLLLMVYRLFPGMNSSSGRWGLMGWRSTGSQAQYRCGSNDLGRPLYR